MTRLHLATYNFVLPLSIFQDSELEVIKARVRAMEEEAEKLKQMQHEVQGFIKNFFSFSTCTISLEYFDCVQTILY